MQTKLYNEYLNLLTQGEIPSFLKKYLTVPSFLFEKFKELGYSINDFEFEKEDN